MTVALSGDGGDENFAGYRRYRWHAYEEQVRSRIPDFIRQPVFGALGYIYPKMDWAPKVLRAKSTLQAIARSSIEGYLNSVSILPYDLRNQMFSSEFTRSADIFVIYDENQCYSSIYKGIIICIKGGKLYLSHPINRKLS